MDSSKHTKTLLLSNECQVNCLQNVQKNVNPHTDALKLICSLQKEAYEDVNWNVELNTHPRIQPLPTWHLLGVFGPHLFGLSDLQIAIISFLSHFTCRDYHCWLFYGCLVYLTVSGKYLLGSPAHLNILRMMRFKVKVLFSETRIRRLFTWSAEAPIIPRSPL